MIKKFYIAVEVTRVEDNKVIANDYLTKRQHMNCVTWKRSLNWTPYKNDALVFENRDEAEEFVAGLPAEDKDWNSFGTHLKFDYTVEEVDYAYANMHGWSDVYPFEIIRVVSNKTIEVRAMIAELDEGFKPEIIPGGFSGHCVNQNKQTYKYKSCPEGQVLRVRLGKKGWKSSMGKHVISEQPRKFYDYNF